MTWDCFLASMKLGRIIITFERVPRIGGLPSLCRIAKAIDKAAKSKHNQEVRELFVDHEGKETICVDLDVFNIYEVDTEYFFSQMASEITGNIKEFFSYKMGLCGCGIKGVEMLGKQEDWNRLVVKIQQIKKELKPIMRSLYGLRSGWFDHVELVFRKLAATYAANDTESLKDAADFWADIFMVGDGWKYGPSGFGGHAAKEYNGWVIEFLTGHKSILEENFWSQNNRELLKGLNSVPMKVSLKYKNPPIEDDSTLVAGIMGFTIHHDTFNKVPALQPNHMWAMKLPPNSPLRQAH